MSRLFFIRLLVALAFFVGQTLAVAHATQHELSLDGKPTACEVCVLGHGHGALQAPMLASLAVLPPDHLPVARPVPAASAASSMRPPGRGPPSFLD